MKLLSIFGFLFLFLLTLSLNAGAESKVLVETSYGNIEIKLYDKKAPITVLNFLTYVKSGFYKGTIFHRVINGFMIQGGGFDSKMVEKANKKKAIKNEAFNKISNEAGTVAMARTSVVDSATSQFFINVGNNSRLDHKSPTPAGYGYAVFGKVTKGMSIVNRIKQVKTGRTGAFSDVPVDAIIIKNIKLL
jgi:peptidyl-prolyl cis-trans isomerase A (cyclophilin A)